jgi:hypothetical protein
VVADHHFVKRPAAGLNQIVHASFRANKVSIC